MCEPSKNEEKMNKELEELEHKFEHKFEQHPHTYSPHQDSHAKMNQNATCVKTPTTSTQYQYYNNLNNLSSIAFNDVSSS